MTSTTPDLTPSVRQIRRRLFRLLIQAFSAVVLLTVVLMFGLFLFIGIDDAVRFGSAITLGRPLQGYYAGRGSWEGVDVILEIQKNSDPIAEREWQNVLLLDSHDTVLIDQGRTDTELIGQTYIGSERDRRVPITYKGQTVGFLISESGALAFRVSPRYIGILAPVIGISFFTGALTLLIGFLLVRRFVNPLADVIAAAHSVAAGDLSARVHVSAPDDLRSLSDSFNRMADALERNDRERRNLLADIAHELRTPLTVIRGRLEGIVDGVYPPDEDHVAPVLAETYVLERLVEDLRILTLAESRQLHFDLKPVQLGDLAERAADLFRAQADAKHISLSVRVEADTPTVQADPQRVGQVIGNLLNNALRYGQENGAVLVGVGPATVNGRARVAVRDDGPGVPESDLPHLFDRFWRGEKSRSRAAGGAGLGLSIAQQLIEAQGGAITAVNVPGGGLEVSFVL